MPKPTRRPYAPRVPIADRREQILDAAIRIIVNDGYERISIESIAREAAITRPVVYSAYEGLGPLLIALLDRQEERAVKQLAEVIPAGLSRHDPQDAALRAIEAWMNQVIADPIVWRPILTGRHSMPALVRERIDQTRDLIREQIAGLLRLGYPSLDIEVNAHILLVVFEHFGELLLDQPDRFTPDRLLNAVRVLLDGWRTSTTAT